MAKKCEGKETRKSEGMRSFQRSSVTELSPPPRHPPPPVPRPTDSEGGLSPFPTSQWTPCINKCRPWSRSIPSCTPAKRRRKRGTTVNFHPNERKSGDRKHQEVQTHESKNTGNTINFAICNIRMQGSAANTEDSGRRRNQELHAHETTTAPCKKHFECRKRCKNRCKRHVGFARLRHVGANNNNNPLSAGSKTNSNLISPSNKRPLCRLINGSSTGVNIQRLVAGIFMFIKMRTNEGLNYSYMRFTIHTCASQCLAVLDNVITYC